MRWFLVLVISVASAQTFELNPKAVRQGQTLRVSSTGPAAVARMNGRTVRLFMQEDGGRLGLMPVPVNEPPGAHTVEFLGSDGSVLHTAVVTVRDARFPEQNVVVGKAQQQLRPSPGEMEAVAALRETISEARHWDEPFASPLAGCMNSPFGVRRLHNGEPTGNYHRGVDQRSPAGRPIRAAAGGTIRIARMFRLHGGTVGIDHGQGVTSIYLHLSGFAVKEGGIVDKGDVIGYVGSTGFATGPHLHWGLNVNGVPVNPLQWVPLRPCAARSKRK
jgi:murein DD-endopeptidase MepM/ murein hydrolase activator NlpD